MVHTDIQANQSRVLSQSLEIASQFLTVFEHFTVRTYRLIAIAACVKMSYGAILSQHPNITHCTSIVGN